MRTCVVGVGNIGLNLLLSLRRAGLEAVGVEVNPGRVAELAEQGVLGVFASPAEAGDVDAWILTTSTGPQLSHLLAAVGAITPKRGALISVESTLPAGTMARLAELFRGRGYTPGEDLFLVHVPHRILFGVEESVFDAARVVGGVTSACLERGLAFYGPLVKELFPVTDVRAAELAKIVENALRFVEVAFAEELFRYCHEQGIDFRTLRGAVNTKGNVRLLDVDYGIGGECLPKDIRFLNEVLGSPLLAGAIATDERYRAALAAAADGAERVLVDGFTYKAGHPDARHSMAVELARTLMAAGKQVFVCDALLTATDAAAFGLTWGDPHGEYDVRYSRPMQITGRQEEHHVEDPGNGQ